MINIYWLGRSPYRLTWDLQERLRRRVLAGGPDTLLLCEHDPVITLGRSASESDILADEATLAAAHIERVRTSRGGQVTYHGPGQLVAYPVVRLTRGVLAHVIALGEAAAQVAAQLGVSARFCRDPVGVFVGSTQQTEAPYRAERKLAAIGVQIKRRVAIHGLALNVTAEATHPFRRGLFLPCGEVGRVVTSLAEERSEVTFRTSHPGAKEVGVFDLVEPLAHSLCRSLGALFVPVVEISTLSLISSLPSVE